MPQPKSLLILLGCLLPLCALATDITVTPPSEVKLDQTTVAPPTAPAARDFTITFSSGTPGNLYLPGQPVDITAHVTNAGKSQKVLLTVLVTARQGCQIYLNARSVQLTDGGTLDWPIAAREISRLPNGCYHIEMWAQGDNGIGYNVTALTIWNGPAPTASDSFGVSYNGPLNTERTWKDLELFRLAGISWLRFPLHGWLPQGDAIPPEASLYDQFVSQATQRNFTLLPAFTPGLTVDPAVDEVQADKQYRESLLAATTRYGFKVKTWDLLQVKPDAKYPELRGIHAKQLQSGRMAMDTADKTLHAVFTVEDPFKWNAIDLFAQKLPLAGDAVGMSHNFIGLPEIQAQPTPPIFSATEINADAQTALKRTPPLWVTEYGFDQSKGARLPSPTLQAALISRAMILNAGQKISRTFWRHTPDRQNDWPLTNADGSAEPGLLAIRTTLQMLEGVTSMTEVPVPVLGTDLNSKKVWAFLLRYDPPKKDRKHDTHKSTRATPTRTHYQLVAWSEARMSSVTLKTTAQHAVVTNLWGNTVELQPVDGVMLFPVDEFPRFVDLGESKLIEASAPFARFTPSALLVTEGGTNRMVLDIYNNQQLFHGKISLEARTDFWPSDSGTRSRRIDLDVLDRVSVKEDIEVPAGARKGQIYEVRTDLLVGSRRIGFLLLPIWYQPKTDTVEK